MMHRTPGEEMIELLTLCQQLQSEKDGLKRPVPRRPGVAADEVMDGFAQRILQSCAFAASLDPLLDLQSRLADVGRRLEEQGQLQTDVGDNYALAALTWMELITGTGTAL
ncbi:MAG: hypothetical protein JO226_08005 [Pluralibacter sp.]|nr:hypothetical protein [Pluralibacter sp.]